MQAGLGDNDVGLGVAALDDGRGGIYKGGGGEDVVGAGRVGDAGRSVRARLGRIGRKESSLGLGDHEVGRGVGKGRYVGEGCQREQQLEWS